MQLLELWLLRPWCLRHHLVCHSEMTVNAGCLCCRWFWGFWQLDWGHQVAKRWWHDDHGKAETALGVARKRLKVKGMKCLKKLFLKPLWHRGIVFLEYFLKEYLLRNFLRGGLRSNYSARGHLRGISRAVRVPSAVRVHATLFYHVLSTKLFWEYHSKGM